MRVVVVGAGIVGCATALSLTRCGVEVEMLDRGPVASGTTSRGEGNVLVSDKPPGPELDLAIASRRRWAQLADELGADALEWQPKGGLVVAAAEAGRRALGRLAADQRQAGVWAEPVTDPRELEPWLGPGLAGGVLYPGDAQVQPVLAAAAMLAEALRLGARFRPGLEVIGLWQNSAGRLLGVRTDNGEQVGADAVVLCAGPWGGGLTDTLGMPLPVLPRRGFILVTEPVPTGRVRHKVYSADYVANVAASTEGLETSCVVESTRAGTILIGASRERVGFDDRIDPTIVQRLAAQAVSLFPFLAGVELLRVYRGFRPYCPDHLPVIGPDPRLPGLFHAGGHEGAGIGLAPATADVIAAQVTGADVLAATGIEPSPFLPDRLLTPLGSRQ